MWLARRARPRARHLQRSAPFSSRPRQSVVWPSTGAAPHSTCTLARHDHHRKTCPHTYPRQGWGLGAHDLAGRVREELSGGRAWRSHTAAGLEHRPADFTTATRRTHFARRSLLCCRRPLLCCMRAAIRVLTCPLCACTSHRQPSNAKPSWVSATTTGDPQQEARIRTNLPLARLPPDRRVRRRCSFVSEPAGVCSC